MTDRTVHWTDRLSEYLDGELGAGDRPALEAHLAVCRDCAGTLEELRRVIARAQALDERPPARDHWPAIAALIGSEATPIAAGRWNRRFTFSLPQLAAAALVLVTLSASGAVWFSRTPVTGPSVAVTPAPQPSAIRPVSARGAAPAAYDSAVAQLQEKLDQGRGRLDTVTIRVLEENLARIDHAIAEAQRAVATDPANVYLNSHLAETRLGKLHLLQRAARLASAQS
jgi:anti-sigma factor RsiW